MRPLPLFAVFLGGGLGASARYGLQLLFGAPAGGFDMATFVANVAGALLLGAMQPALKRARPAVAGFFGPGLLGGFTTYSALMVSPIVTARAGDVSGSVGYFLLTLGCGFLAAWAGYRITGGRHG